jgi:hypothetical protein
MNQQPGGRDKTFRPFLFLNRRKPRMSSNEFPNLSDKNSTITPYPPAPWDMQGQLYGSIWAVPQSFVALNLPLSLKKFNNLGYAGVFAGFVDYQPGSTLTYHELIAGLVVKVRNRFRFGLHVSHIWVDNETSLQGGREIWGVPKQLADFNYTYSENNRSFNGIASSGGKVLATGNFRTVLGLPGNLKAPCPFPNLQQVGGQIAATSGMFTSNFRFCKGGMVIPAESKLAELGIAGRNPLVSFAGLNFTMHLKAPHFL